MGGIRVGRIFGLEIRIDYSWFIIFFLILWTLTTGVFPANVPDLDTGTYVAMGVVGTFLFFASLLGHEISHSLVARRRGIPVEGITLFIFGGMARTRMEAEEPRDELAIAGVGPLASLVIGALFGVVAWAGASLGWSAAVTAVAGYLALINVALAVFNLLPGFPLDGGRLFRAAAWKWTGDLTRATRWATTGGKWLGYALIGLGIAETLFTGALIGGLWLVFIGWFVRTAAAASFAQHLLLESLAGVRVRQLMTPEPAVVPADLLLRTFAEEYILAGRHRAYPVVEDGSPVGVMPLERLRDTPRAEWDERTVGDAMLPLEEGGTAHPDEPVARALERLAPSGHGRLLVVRDGTLVGVLTRGDLSRWLERAKLLEGEAGRTPRAGAG